MIRLRILGPTTLETRFLRADLIEVFKILRGFENLDPDRYFQVVGNGARRGHSFKLFKKRYRLDVLMCSNTNISQVNKMPRKRPTETSWDR